MSVSRTNLIAILLLAGSVMYFAAPAAAQGPWGKPPVGVNSLYGWYGLLVTGASATPNSGGKYLTGALFFDGKGSITANNINGGINGQFSNTSATGTVVANTAALTQGTLTITLNLANSSTPQTYIVSPRLTALEAVGIETDGTAIATIDLQSQIVFWQNSFNSNFLNGTFASSCTGINGNAANIQAQMNYVTFDGRGNLQGVDPYNIGNIEGINPFSGTYTVYPDGTFFAQTAPTVTINGVIDSFYTEIEYTYNVSGYGELLSCVGKK